MRTVVKVIGISLMWLSLVRCDTENTATISGADGVDYTKEQVAEALGLAVSDIVDFAFSTNSGADDDTDLTSIAVNPAGGGVFLSTGDADDDGAGNTDLLSDDKADSTEFSITLSVPSGMQSLVYSPLFNTAEYGGSDPNADRAEVSFSTGSGPVTLARVEATPVTHPVEIRAVDVSSASTVTATFLIEDAVNGLRDSGLLLRRFFFTEAEIVTGDVLAQSLSLPDGSLVDARVEATSGAVRIVDVLSARTGNLSGSVLLTTGFPSGQESLGERERLGNADIAGDDVPDATLFHLTLNVPQVGGNKSLVFRTQFLTSEFDSSVHADTANVVSAKDSSPSSSQDIGGVASSLSAEDPPVTRAVDVEGAERVSIDFKISDAGDRGQRDSGLLLSALFFSELEASLFPRPDNAQLRTGTYAYSKTLLAASGSMSPFGFLIHYNSAPRSTSGRMGSRWGHSYDWGITELDNGDVSVRRGDGRVEWFEPDPAGGHVPKYGGQVFNRLGKEPDGSYLYVTTQQMRYAFDEAGKLVSISDSNGNQTVLSFTDGLLSTVTDTRQQIADFTYDTERRLTGVSYAFQSVSFAYAGADLISFTDPDGNSTSFTYDANHNLLTGTDGNGDVFVENVYDELHRVTRQHDAKRALSETSYDSSTSTLIDRVRNTQVTTFDPLDRQTLFKDGTESEWRYAYDKNDNLTSTTDPFGATTSSMFDERGNTTATLDALDGLVTTDYDPANLPIKATDEVGDSISFEYDANGNILRDIDALGVARVFEYDERGLRTRSTDRRGNMFAFRYSEAGDLVEATDPHGGVARLEYDDLGREIASFDANGNGTFLTFNGLGQVTSTTDALGFLRTLTYGAEGRLRRETNPLGETTAFEYSPTGKLVRLTDALGFATESEYNGEDLLVAVSDPLGNTTSFAYDKALRLNRTTDPLGGQVVAEYDQVGNRVAVTDPNGHTTRYTYDETRLNVSETDPLGNSVLNTYDARGRVISITNARGQTIELDYDAGARLTNIHLPDHDIEYVLDANGNRTVTKGRDGRRSKRKFDALNRMVRFTDVNGNTIRYKYDAVGNLLAITYSDGAVVRYTYDALNRMTSVTDWHGRKTRYAYDAAGRLRSARLPDKSHVAYEYDAVGRLLSIDDTSHKGVTTFRTQYTLGPSGLRIAEDAELPLEAPVTSVDRAFEHNAANQIVSDNGVPFAYDADGNMIRGVVGRLPVELLYDESNRLIEVGASRYEYDDDGLRIKATVNGKRVHYVQDPNAALPRVLEEHDRHGRIVARYVYGIGLVSRHGHADHDYRHQEQVSVYHFDSRGSTVALTNLYGQVTDRFAYDPFGLIVARDGDTPNPYTYNGRDGVMDDGNGLYFMRARYYEPRLMRFVSRDDVELGSLDDTQSLNRYAYARGNPIHGIDPSGQWFGLDDLVMAVGGAIAGVASVFVSDLINSAIAGEWQFSSEEAYAGAAVGGFVGGATLMYVGPVAAGALAGAAGNATTQALSIAAGKQTDASGNITGDFNFIEFGTAVGLGAVAGRLIGGKPKLELKNLAKAIVKKQLPVRTAYRSFGRVAFNQTVASTKGAIKKRAVQQSLRESGRLAWGELQSEVIGPVKSALVFVWN